MSFEIIKNMSYEDYALRTEINGSKLKIVHEESLATVKAVLDGKVKLDSQILRFGTAFHSLVLEGKKEYVIRPDEYEFGKKWTMAANFCKEWVARQKLPVMSSKEAESLEGMAKACQDHPELSKYLCGQTELSVFAQSGGISLKARIDLLPDNPDAPIIDFKKTRSARPEEFVKQIWNLRYYFQSAINIDVLRMAGIDRREFWFVAIEDCYPYNIFIAKMEDNGVGFIDLGRREYRIAYHKLMTAIQKNEWPSYGAAPAENYLTQWMIAAIADL